MVFNPEESRNERGEWSSGGDPDLGGLKAPGIAMAHPVLGGEKFEVLVNPSESNVIKMMNRFKSEHHANLDPDENPEDTIRVIKDNGGNLYAWPAWSGSHDDVVQSLGLKVDQQSQIDIWHKAGNHIASNPRRLRSKVEFPKFSLATRNKYRIDSLMVDVAKRSTDPGRTRKLRQAFDASGKMQLNRLRATLRQAIVDYNVLGLSAGPANFTFMAPAARLNQFAGWLETAANASLDARWWVHPWIDKATQHGLKASQIEMGGSEYQPIPTTFETLHQMAHDELRGIIGALIQKVMRSAHSVSARGLVPHKAYRELVKPIDGDIRNRLKLFSQYIITKGHVHGKVAYYRHHGINQVGINPELRRGKLVKRDHIHDVSNLAEVGWQTAGDDLVCADCEDMASGSPYTLDEILALIPLHASCRCEPVMWDDDDYSDSMPSIRFRCDAFDPNEPRNEKGEWGSGTTGPGLERKTSEGKNLPAHIIALKIPPAWKNVRYDPDPNAALLVTGKDAKGRKQSIYSDKHTMKQAASKFARINALSNKFESIKKENSKIKSDEADALSLIMHTGIRPGSDKDTGGAVKAYGATTLEGRHVKESSLQFVGKKGVKLNIKITDKHVMDMLHKRAAAAGPHGRLFGNMDAGDLLQHVHEIAGPKFNTKDFRTLLGTTIASDLVDSLPNPKNYKAAVKDVAKKVSARLGNTPIVALQSYINPTVFAPWKSLKMSDGFSDNMVHFGSAFKSLPDWRLEIDEIDPDDEEIKTPEDVIDMLGFDPAKEDGFVDASFNSEEDRDDHGRWSAGGETGTPGSSGKHAAKLLEKFGKEALGGREITDKELNAVASYNRLGFNRINNSLRKGKEAKGPAITLIDSAISKSILPRDAMVFRGSGTNFGDSIEKGLVENKSVEFSDKSFVSTSASKSEALVFSHDLIQIKIPKGTAALSIPTIAYPGGPIRNHDEAELLLGRGHTFRVTGMIKKGDRRTFDVELMS